MLRVPWNKSYLHSIAESETLCPHSWDLTKAPVARSDEGVKTSKTALHGSRGHHRTCVGNRDNWLFGLPTHLPYRTKKCLGHLFDGDATKPNKYELRLIATGTSACLCHIFLTLYCLLFNRTVFRPRTHETSTSEICYSLKRAHST